MSREIWVLCSGQRECSHVSLELVELARRLRDSQDGYICCAVCFDQAPADINSYCEKLYLLHGAGPMEDSRGRVLAYAIEKFRPHIVLAAATGMGRSICAIAAAKCGTGLTADATGFELDNDGLLKVTRPALGGSMLACILCPYTLPQMATVRPGMFPTAKAERLSWECVEVIARSSFKGSELIAVSPCAVGLSDLRDSQIILSGGLGLGSRENFEKLFSYAEKIGAQVAASRGAVNAGMAAYSRQIGLSGLCVKPDVYIALGISGAVQHLAGIRLAKTIIAVNTDSKAPIFNYADIGIVAHWQDYLDGLIDRIKPCGVKNKRKGEEK